MRRRPLFGLVVGLGATIALVACSLVVDTNKTQCTTTADCVSRGGAFAGLVCGPDNTCVKQGGCSTNQECIDANGGQAYICRTADRTCVSLASDDCRVVSDPTDIANDGTAWVGVMNVFTGATANVRGAVYGDAIELARREIASVGNGLPPIGPGKPRRPVAFLYCDQNVNLQRASDHMLKDLGIKIVVGPIFSGTVISFAQNNSIPANALTLVPGATSALITTLNAGNPRLLWRMIASDNEQADVMTALMKATVEPAVRTNTAVTGDIRVALVNKGDAYGTSASAALIKILQFNGKSITDNGANFKEINYGNPDDPAQAPSEPAKYAQTVADLLTFQPHVVIGIGTSEILPNILKPFETQWPAALPFKVHYIGDNGISSSGAEIVKWVGNNADLQKRILGSQPGAPNANLTAFLASYNSTFTDGTNVTVAQIHGGAYDSTYLAYYSLIGLGDKPLTGDNLAKQMCRMTPKGKSAPGRLTPVGPAAIFQAEDDLSKGLDIDFDGVAGPLDFDCATGDVTSDETIWCIKTDGTGTTAGIQASGMIYKATSLSLSGAITSCP